MESETSSKLLTPLRLTAIVVVLAVIVAFVVVWAVRDSSSAVELRQLEPNISYQTHTGNNQHVDADDNALVLLDDVPVDHDSALVRLTVQDVAEELTVSVLGAPALNVAQGSASTVVLVPATESGFELTTTSNARVDVEVLASFHSNPDLPGATIALDEPVLRANTNQGLAATSDDLNNPVEVPVVGLGGVPSTDVRAVYLTATVTTSEPTDVTIGNQNVHVPAGQTSVTTVAAPDELGNVPVEGHGLEAVRVDVRGWVPEAPQNTEANNIAGSYVPVLDGEHTELSTQNSSASFNLAEHVPADAATVLALVSAQETEHNAVVEFDGAAQTQGAITDAQQGALTQLMVADADATELRLSEGEAELDIVVVGVFLGAFQPGEESTEDSSSKITEVTIEEHSDGQAVSLADHGTFELNGTIGQAATSLESVHVYANNTLVGAAVIRHTSSGTQWSFETSAPRSRDYQFRVEVTDRAGNTNDSTVDLGVTLPEEDDVVIASNVSVLSSQDSADQVLEVTENAILFGERPDVAPGEILVADSSETTPQGFLRRVQAIDFTSDGWLVTTVPATLNEAILQANVRESVDFLANNVVLEDLPASDGSDPNYQLVPGPEQPVQLVKNSRAATASSAENVAKPVSHHVPTRVLADDDDLLVDIDFQPEVALGFSLDYEISGDLEKVIDLSKTKDDSDDSDDGFKAKGSLKGAAFAKADLEVTLTVDFGLEISTDWEWGVVPVAVVDEFRWVFLTDAVGETETGLTLGASGGIEGTKTFNTKLNVPRIPPLTVPIGPIPVVLTSDLSLKTDINVKASVSVEGNATVQLVQDVARSTAYGFIYDAREPEGERIHHIDEQNYSSKEPELEAGTDAGIKGSLDVNVGPKIGFTVYLYDTFGPEVELGFVVGGELSYENTVSDTKTLSNQSGTEQDSVTESTHEAAVLAYIDLTGKGSVKFKVPIIDLELMSMEMLKLDIRFELWKHTWDFSDEVEASAQPSPDALPFTQIEAGGGFSIAVTPHGDVYFWGRTSFDDDWDETQRILEPQRVEGLEDVSMVAAGRDHLVAVTNAGEVYTWGANDSGQLGDGTTSSKQQPQRVHGISDVKAVSAGPGHTLALTRNGKVFAWGNNAQGQLGSGNTTTQYIPGEVSGLGRDIQAIEASPAATSFALTTTGEVFAWGSNFNAGLGDGTSQDRHTPVQLDGLPEIVQISAGASQGVALTVFGDVYVWGDSGHAWELQSDPQYLDTSPRQETSLANITAIDADDIGNMVLDEDGLVYMWGWVPQWNGPTVESRRLQLTPERVEELEDVALIAQGATHHLAMTQDGKLYGWGHNLAGQVGNGTTEFQETPVEIVLPEELTADQE